MRIGHAAAVALAAAAACLAGTARADTPVLAQGLGLPWTDPAHQSPLEQLLAPIAARVAGRGFAIRCEGDTDWGTLARSRGFDPAVELGYAANDGVLYSRATGRYVTSGTLVELSPGVCQTLQEFAQAATKPTKCTPLADTPVTVTTPVRVTRYRTVVVKKTTRIDGKLRKPGTYHLPYTVVEQRPTQTTTKLPGPPVPCWTGEAADAADPSATCWASHDGAGQRSRSCFRAAQAQDVAYWSRYASTATALATVAHEAVHEWQMQAGQPVPAATVVEAQAECIAMQWVAAVAVALGDTDDDGRAIADFLWKVRFPETRYFTGDYPKAYPYWSAGCVPGGPFDVRSDTSHWP